MTPDHAIYSEEAGHFVNAKIQRLAEILQDYDDRLELRWIPPGNRSDLDKSLPYCIVHSLPGKKPYVVTYFGENEAPETILAKIFAGDNWRENVVARMDAQNAAYEAFRLKEQLDERMLAADQFHFLATSRSGNYVNWGRDPKTGKKIRLDSNRRRI